MNTQNHEFPENEARADQNSETRRDAARTLAELFERAVAYDCAAGTSADAEKWFCGESESLLQWAGERKLFLPPVEFGSLIEGFKLLEGGLEHQVFFKKRSGRVFKITKPPHFGHTWYLKDYIRNVIWCNAVFEDDIRLEGVIQRSDGVSLVISQPYILGRSPTESELENWFTMQDGIRLGKHRWRFPDGLVVSDTHTGNLILMKDGTLVPIDLHIESLGNRAIT